MATGRQFVGARSSEEPGAMETDFDSPDKGGL